MAAENSICNVVKKILRNDVLKNKKLLQATTEKIKSLLWKAGCGFYYIGPKMLWCGIS